MATATTQTSWLKRESLTDQTAHAIRNAILTGEFALGRKLKESELSTRYGVSHSVVREALHVLQGEGLVVTKPYCGRSVFTLTETEALELTVMRASLESLAAYLAAEKITDEWAGRILSAAAVMKSAAAAGYPSWVDRELNFHRTVWVASGNDWLVRQLSQSAVPTLALGTLRLFRNSLDWDVEKVQETTSSWEKTDGVRGHQSVARAIAGGHAARAREMMIRHILGSPHLVGYRKALFAMS